MTFALVVVGKNIRNVAVSERLALILRSLGGSPPSCRSFTLVTLGIACAATLRHTFTR